MYTHKHILILGLGESGLAAARWCAKQGAVLRVADTRVAPEHLAALQAAVPEADFIGRQALFSSHLLEQMDFVIVSPGLSPYRELVQLLLTASQYHIPVWGEIELFAQALADLKRRLGYTPKVLAVTGTNGKTTVTRLTGLLCQQAGLHAQVAGNIHPAVLDALSDALTHYKNRGQPLPDVWVLELSSFQLHWTFSWHPHAATVLNITQDHLDWHGNMAAYIADKARIFGPEATINPPQHILNRDDSRVMDMPTTMLPFVTFGTNLPTQENDFGLMHHAGATWLSVMEKGQIQPLLATSDLRILGRHNAMNALAALALCRTLTLPWSPLLEGLRYYSGESHRMQWVAQIQGVDYYDDSKGTNVGATVAAIEGLPCKLVIILGGDSKGQDFSPLILPLCTQARACVLIGQDAPRLHATLAGPLSTHAIPLIMCGHLINAVEQAACLAKAGDAVILSPACASFDQFRDYTHRAQVFVEAVYHLRGSPTTY